MVRTIATVVMFSWMGTLVACGGAAKDVPADNLDPDGDGSVVDDDASSDVGGLPGFDVSPDTAPVGDALQPDATCAASEAAAIKPPVDIIFAIDQSGSMSDDIANVKANINKLAEFLGKTGLDYRVVMIATPGTSTYQVCVPPPLGAGAPSCASTAKLRVVNRNVLSTDALKIYLETYDAPAGSPTAWADFLRKEAFKVFVPVTDDDSRGSMPKADQFDTQLLAKPGGQFGTAAKRNYAAYPICGAPAYPNATPKCGDNAVNASDQVRRPREDHEEQVVPDLPEGLRSGLRGDGEEHRDARRVRAHRAAAADGREARSRQGERHVHQGLGRHARGRPQRRQQALRGRRERLAVQRRQDQDPSLRRRMREGAGRSRQQGERPVRLRNESEGPLLIPTVRGSRAS